MSAQARFTRTETAAGWTGASDLDDAWREARSAGAVVKDEVETLLVRHPAPSGTDAWWKLYRVPGWRRVQATFTRSRALREWRALGALRKAGVPAVEPLAFGERRGGFQLHESLLVTADRADHVDLRIHLADAALQPAVRSELLKAAGRTARTIHDAGFGHFRMQLRNLLVPPAGPEQGLVVLDAPYACAYPGPAPERVRIIDLIDLAGIRSGLDDEEARTVLYAYAGADEPPADLRTVRTRRPFAQKLRRIGYYLLHTHTGHKPAA